MSERKYKIITTPYTKTELDKLGTDAITQVADDWFIDYEHADNFDDDFDRNGLIQKIGKHANNQTTDFSIKIPVEDSDDLDDEIDDAHNNPRDNQLSKYSHDDLGGYASYKNLDKIKIKIYGTLDEDIIDKLTDIELYKEISDKQ